MHGKPLFGCDLGALAMLVIGISAVSLLALNGF